MRFSIFGFRITGPVILATIVIAVAALWLVNDRRSRTYALTMTAGSASGARAQLAAHLLPEAARQGVGITLSPTAGSAEALEKVASGALDAALVQGGLPAPPGVLQLAALYPEPLHLLVRPELEGQSLTALRGKRVNLGPGGSGTRVLAIKVMDFAGLRAGVDFQPLDLTYEVLEGMAEAEKPDAIFMVQSLPSPLAGDLVRRHGYRLNGIPFGESLEFRDLSIVEVSIPRMMYSVEPAVPSENLATLGNHMLLVANERVSEEAVECLLGAVYAGDFARHANLPMLLTHAEVGLPEYPYHPGAERFKKRQEPILRSDVIDNIESMRSFGVSIAIAIFLAWRWYDRRKAFGFQEYIRSVTKIESQVTTMEKNATLDLATILRLRNELGELKNEALEKFTSGELKDDELMASFLQHVMDARDYLNSLLLHERERLERIALRGQNAQAQEKSMQALWNEALADQDLPPPS